MHACGHDGHTASLLGAAALLAADTTWTGTVQLVFQPAEEGYGGARSMIADGLFERFPMERIFGYHNWPGLEAGTVAVHPGAVMAAGSRIDIVVDGHAGHAAMPHLSRDPLLAAAHLTVALQSLVARNVDPIDTAVVSVCMMNAGVATNQIPSRAVLRGTFRTHREPVRYLIEAGINRIAAGVAATFDVAAAVTITHGVSATVNSPAEADLAAAAAAGAGGAGGGAVQLIAKTSITIAAGGVVNAGGGGGEFGGESSSQETAGGGSGGSILLEAQDVSVSGTLAANGGGVTGREWQWRGPHRRRERRRIAGQDRGRRRRRRRSNSDPHEVRSRDARRRDTLPSRDDAMHHARKACRCQVASSR